MTGFWCSRYKAVVLAALAGACLNCIRQDGAEEALMLAVYDVGQGLAQLVHREGIGIACDVGTAWSAAAWHAAYRREGSPRLSGLLLSHSDADHVGGLAGIDTAVDFSGLVYLGPGEDTARVLQYAGAWAPRIRFRRVSAGDTIGGVPGVLITVLWPPACGGSQTSATTGDRNHFSVVARVVYGWSRALLTGDIDTIAMRELSAVYGMDLRSQLLVAPHHGSAGSVDRVFYGYVRPERVVVSCGENNHYGHPAPALVDLVFEMGVALHVSWREGHFLAASQGYYWTLR